MATYIPFAAHPRPVRCPRSKRTVIEHEQPLQQIKWKERLQVFSLFDIFGGKVFQALIPSSKRNFYWPTTHFAGSRKAFKSSSLTTKTRSLSAMLNMVVQTALAISLIIRSRRARKIKTASLSQRWFKPVMANALGKAPDRWTFTSQLGLWLPVAASTL